MLQTAELTEEPELAEALFLSGAGSADGEARTTRLGPFLVDENGLLRPASESGTPTFSVRWRGRTLRASIEAEAAGRSRQNALALEIVVGRVPSTASPAGGAERRERIFALLRLLAAKLPPGWQLRLLPDHHYGIMTAQPIRMPASAADLLVGVTAFLVSLDAYLAVLDKAGFGFSEDAPAAGGTAKT